MNLGGKRVDLIQLRAELVAAGVAVTALGTAGDELHTYSAGGDIVDLPPAAAAVLTAHVPPPIPDPVVYGTDLPQPVDIAALVAGARAYLALASPTPAQTVTAVKGLVRVALFLLRRAI